MPGALRLAHVCLLAGWLTFAAVWGVAALFGRPDKRRQAALSRLWQLGLLAAGAALLFASARPVLNPQLLPASAASVLVGALLTDAGLGFAIYARAVLGRNWSGTVSLKEGHQLMESGPYALVRHPIYTGLLTALLGTALVRGTLAAFLGVGILTLVFLSKIRLEERFLASEFGSAFDSYRARVKALIPFVV